MRQFHLIAASIPKSDCLPATSASANNTIRLTLFHALHIQTEHSLGSTREFHHILWFLSSFWFVYVRVIEFSRGILLERPTFCPPRWCWSQPNFARDMYGAASSILSENISFTCHIFLVIFAHWSVPRNLLYHANKKCRKINHFKSFKSKNKLCHFLVLSWKVCIWSDCNLP